MAHIHSDTVRISESTPANHVVNPVVFEVLLDIVSACSHSLFLGLLHLIKVSLDVASFDTHAAKLFLCDSELVSVVKQSFGRNAAFINAHTANVRTIIDANSLEPLLGCTDGCCVATRPSTDDSYVIFFLSGESPILLL